MLNGLRMLIVPLTTLGLVACNGGSGYYDDNDNAAVLGTLAAVGTLVAIGIADNHNDNDRRHYNRYRGEDNGYDGYRGGPRGGHYGRRCYPEIC